MRTKAIKSVADLQNGHTDWDGPISPSVGRGARLERYIEPYHSPHSPGFRWHNQPDTKEPEKE